MQPSPVQQKRRPVRLKLQIEGPLWSDILPELRTAWMRKKAENKEQVIAQFKEPLKLLDLILTDTNQITLLTHKIQKVLSFSKPILLSLMLMQVLTAMGR